MPREELPVTPAAEEFYIAAGQLVAAIQDVFPDPLRLYPCPIGEDEHEPPSGLHSQWWGFVYAGNDKSPIHPTNRHLLNLVPGLWKLREALRAPGVLLKGREDVGSGRRICNGFLRNLYGAPWLIEPDEREHDDRRFWLRPPSAGLADQLRSAARDLEFPAVVEKKGARPAGQLSELGTVDHLKRQRFRDVKAKFKKEGHWNVNVLAAAVVNKEFGTKHKSETLRVMAEGKKKPKGGRR